MEATTYRGINFKDVHMLWNDSLGKSWPINKTQLEKRVSQGINFVVEEQENLIGFINCQYANKEGQITLIMIKTSHQRKGIGTLLLNKAVEFLRKEGAAKIFIGSGAGSYFWPGVPKELVNAITFFKKNEFRAIETNFDMVRNLEYYQIPVEIQEYIKELNLKFDSPTETTKNDLIKFEKLNFPEWVEYFRIATPRNILVAKIDNTIVGTCILSNQKEFTWPELLNSTGGFGVLGVSEAYRNKGIGLSLAATATQVLKERGNSNSFLGWTYLDKWYGKLGYKVWKEYVYGQML